MFAHSTAEFLELNNFGTQDINIFVNNFPSRTDMPDLISVYDSQPYSIRGKARNSVRFKCQIRVRNCVEGTAQKIALDIYNLLNRGVMFDKSGKRFVIKPLNPPTFLMYDEMGRANWVLNVSSIAYNY